MFLKVNEAISGIRKLRCHLSQVKKILYKTPIGGEEAFEKIKDIEYADFGTDMNKKDLDLNSIYDYFNAVEKENMILLDMYIDYLEDKVRES